MHSRLLYLLSCLLLIVGSARPEGCLAREDVADTQSINQLIKAGKAISAAYPDSALVLLERALLQSSEQHFENGISQSAKYLSGVYASHGMIERFRQTFDTALLICRREHLNRALPQLYQGIGYTYLVKGMKNEALDYYYQAISIAEQYALPLALAKLYNNIVSTWPDYWSPDQAFAYLDKAEKIARLYKDNELLVYITNNRGYVLSSKNPPKAIVYYKEALELARKNNLLSMQYLTTVNIGGAYGHSGQPKKAIDYLQQAEALQGDIPPSYRCLAYNLLGSAYLSNKEYTLAEKYLLKAVATASAYKINIYLQDAHSLLSDLYNETRDYKKAYFEQRIYSALKDSFQNERMLQNINLLEVKYQTAQKDKELAEKKLKISVQENYLREKNIWIGGISAAALLLALLSVSYYRISRHKRRAQNRQIRLLQQEQEVLQQEKEISQLKAMIKGEEKERSRIGRELHDGIGGMLTAINMNLNAIQKQYEELRPVKALDSVRQMLDDTSAEVRKTAHNLMPDVLLHHSLKDALVLYFEQLNNQNHLRLELQLYGDTSQLEKSSQLTLYRIIQELVQNIIKHAQASYAAVQIMKLEEKLSVIVEDNGVGFSQRDTDNGYGLQNLKFRVQSLQGHIYIMSTPGRGTTINMEFDTQKLNGDNRAPEKANL